MPPETQRRSAPGEGGASDEVDHRAGDDTIEDTPERRQAPLAGGVR